VNVLQLLVAQTLLQDCRVSTELARKCRFIALTFIHSPTPNITPSTSLASSIKSIEAAAVMCSANSPSSRYPRTQHQVHRSHYRYMQCQSLSQGIRQYNAHQLSRAGASRSSLQVAQLLAAAKSVSHFLQLDQLRTATTTLRKCRPVEVMLAWSPVLHAIQITCEHSSNASEMRAQGQQFTSLCHCGEQTFTSREYVVYKEKTVDIEVCTLSAPAQQLLFKANLRCRPVQQPGHIEVNCTGSNHCGLFLPRIGEKCRNSLCGSRISKLQQNVSIAQVRCSIVRLLRFV